MTLRKLRVLYQIVLIFFAVAIAIGLDRPSMGRPGEIHLTPSKEFHDIVQDLSSAVAFVREKPGAKSRSGTAFFLYNRPQPYLATAQHVAKFLKLDSPITIRTEGDKPLTVKLNELVAKQTALNWIVHQEADVALLPLRSDAKILESRFLDASMLVPEKKAPLRGFTLTVLGFPLKLGVERFFSPIASETRAASGLLTFPRFDTKRPATFFVTQDPSIGGFSGAPVLDTKLPVLGYGGALQVREGGVTIVGLVHGTLSDRTGGKLGAIVPSYYILEALNGQNIEKKTFK